MPVQKFATFKEAHQALYQFKKDDEYYQRISRFFDFVFQLQPMRYPAGIFKFLNFAEANEHRRQLELQHAKRIQNSNI